MVYYGLLLFFLLEYVRPTSYIPALNVLHLNSVVPLGVLLGSQLTNLRVATGEVLASPNARWIMFLVCLIGLSGLICDVKIYALTVFINVLGYFLMYVALRKEVYDFERIKGVFGILLVAHVVVGLLTPQMFSGDGERHYITSGSFLGDGNDFALSVNVALPMCLYLFGESKSVLKKLLFGGMLVVLVVAVVVTQSRGGILALACMGIYFWLRSNKKVIGLLGMVFVFGVVMVSAPPQLFDRMERLTGENIDGSAQGRLLAWGAGVRMALDHPLVGVGAGHFPVKYGVDYRPEGYGPNEIPWQTAHSSYFLILGELGLPGIVFLLGIMFHNILENNRALRRFKHGKSADDLKRYRLLHALTASWVAFAVGGAFLSAAYYPHVYLLAALSECARRMCAEPNEVNEMQDQPDGILVHSYNGVQAR
jgi:probable O-glycosylation ligase (exosortase A-associated)